MIPRFRFWSSKDELLSLIQPAWKDYIRVFEAKIAKKFNARYGISFPYGRVAQWSFLKAMGIMNTEIIMPAYTCSVVAHSISLSNNIPVFVDIDLDTYNINLESLKKNINKNTSVIIITNTFGNPADALKIKKIVNKAEQNFKTKIWIVQDCCHSFGASYAGRLVSDFGDVSIYGFNISKLITSIFGGVLTTNNRFVEKKIRKWRDKNLKKSSLSKILSRRLYFFFAIIAFSRLFYKYTFWLTHKTSFLNKYTKSFHLDEKIHFPKDYDQHMANIEAKIGIIQLNKYDKIIDERRRQAKNYVKAFQFEKKIQICGSIAGATYSHFPARVSDKKAFIEGLRKEGVEIGEVLQYSIPHLPCYANLGYNCKNAKYASKHTINLPLGPHIDTLKIIKKINKYLLKV